MDYAKLCLLAVFQSGLTVFILAPTKTRVSLLHQKQNKKNMFTIIIL